METDVKKQLFDRLDECLMWNASIPGQVRTASLDTVYGLGRLIERHRYLKTEHEFASGEAEALLDFRDPLFVAQACWQKNRSASDFPICSILKDIRAYEQYDLVESAQERVSESLVGQLKGVLDKNYATYTASLMVKSKQELIEQSESIAITRTAYAYMKDDFRYEYREAALLLKLDDPLGYLASRWPIGFDGTGDDDGVIQEVITDLRNPEYLQSIQQASAAAQPEKPSLRGQLQTAMQEVSQRPSQDGRAQHQSDIPNL